MTFFSNMTLRKKLVISFIIILVFTLLTIIVMNIHSVNVERKMLAERKGNINLFNLIVNAKLAQLKGFVKNYSRHPQLIEYMTIDVEDSTRQNYLHQWLKKYLANNEFHLITVTDNQGYVLARANKIQPNDSKRRLYSSFISESLKGKDVSGFEEIIGNELEAEGLLELLEPGARSMENRGLLLKATAPIMGKDQNIIGTLTTGYLVNNEHQLVYDSSQKLTNVIEAAIYYNDHKITASNDKLPELLSSIPAFTQSNNDTIVIWLQNKKNTVVSRKIINDYNGKSIGSLVLMEWDSVFESYQSRRKIHLFLFFIVAAILGGLSLYLIDHNLSKPIKDFQEAISRAENGDFSARVAFTGDDELGQLGLCFNNMIDKIENMVEQERKRGQELQLLNKSTKDISVIHDLELLWHLIMERVITVMKVEACSLYLKDANTNRLECKLSGGSGTGGVEPTLLITGEKIAEQVVQSSKPQKLKIDRQKPINGHTFDTLLSAPLISRNETIGALNIYNKESRQDFSDNDVSLLLTLAGQAAISINNAILYNEVGERERMKKELEIAKSIQKELRPSKMPTIENLSISGSMKQIDEVGGDYLDFFPNSEGTRVVIALGSVFSKGVEASIIKMMMKTVLHCLAGQLNSPVKVLTLVTDILAGNLEEKELMSLFYGIWDAKNRLFTYANAGHEMPVLYHENTKSCERLLHRGRLVGKYDDFELLIKDASITINPDDRLVLYTKGLIELKNQKNIPFGEDKLINIIQENGHLDAPDLRKLILDATTQHSSTTETPDDITLVVLQGL